ncbi:hypothetical protein Halar_2156 [halophilic archaeon DL31]|nr:hypothetical protein Halar_2156 [halophilic archaeon DL31]
MPITKQRFEQLGESQVAPETNAERIVEFLTQHAKQAFRITEIHEGTGVKKGSVGPTLSRLKERGVVEHRGNYWAISDSYLTSQEAVAHTSETAAEYDNGKEFDVASWAAEADDENAEQYTE